MEKLTQKMKRQLAYLMICTLFFNSVPTWDMLVYAQGDGNANTLSDSTSGGDVSGNGTTSGNDTPGTGSGEDADIIPSHDGFDYDGFEMVTDEDDNILADVSGNDISNVDITDTMHVYAKETVTCEIEISNVQDIDKIKVFDEVSGRERTSESTSNDITDEIKKDDLEDNRWRLTISVAEVGEHVIKLKYCKENSTLEEFAKSATIIVDKTEAKLDVSCSDLQSAWWEEPVERDRQLSGEQIEEANALYFKGSTNLYFTITEEHFREKDVQFKVDSNHDVGLTWDGSDDRNTAGYEISGMGEHTICLNYQDRSGNEPLIEFPTRVILDNTDPILDTVSYTEWDHVVSSGDLSTIDGYRERQSQDVNIYYGLDEDESSYNVDMTFTIIEANFHGEDVVIKDNGELVSNSLEWIPGTNTEDDFWTTMYVIPKDNVGKHVVTLEYSDRSGNDPIVYTSETIILDFQNPEISFGNNFTTDGEDGGKIVYCGKGQKVNLIIDEENFRATDVTISSGDAAAKELIKKINAELKFDKVENSSCHVAALDFGNNNGEYNIAVDYVDLAMNAAEKERALIKVDVDSPKVVKESYDENEPSSFRRKVGKNNTAVTGEDNVERYIYQGPMTFELTIEEKNFDAGLARVSVCRNGEYLGENDYCYKWNSDKDSTQHTLSIQLGDIEGNNGVGNYQVKVDCEDLATNKMTTYSSKIITIDTKEPQIVVFYDNNDAKNDTYYQKARKATITVTDANVMPEDIMVSVTAKDIQGNAVPFNLNEELETWNLDEKGNWKNTITFDVDANYEFNIECTDMAENSKRYKPTPECFTVDGTPPDTDDFKIEYSTPIVETPEGSLENAFYKDSVTVKITAEDKISPIDSFEWVYKKQPGASSINQESETQVIDSNNAKFTYDATKASATAEFTLTADEIKQYRGNISFKATDKAGNTSEELTDSNQIVIVDNISPTRKVEYSKAKQIVNKDTLETLKGFDYASENVNAALYYDEAMKVTFKVTEANFYAGDIVLKVNGTAKAITDWSKDGDEWTGSLDIAGDGEYVVTMQYIDRSTNRMIDYTSHTIIIDTVKPKINISYAPNDAKQTIDGIKYYDTEQTATITIEERNFRADDVKAVVKATDINGNSIDVQDFSAYLSNRDNWVTKGDTHTAKIEFVKDANYEFDIDYKDLALISADDYPKDVFTVDQTAPTNVSVSYSSPISERTILGTEYSFYQDPIVVTITAEDDVSGVHSFDYSYIRATGVSSVNAESISDKMEGKDIKYSDDKKTATATFVIPASELRSGNQLNGNMEFVANNRSMLNTEYKDSNRYVVDNIAPNVTITVNGTEQQADGSSYYSEDVNITITVDEANFYKEDVKVSISKDGGEQYAAGVYWKTVSVDRHVGSITLTEEGNYKVYISYQDPSTNGIEDYQSNLLIIDKTQPSINVSGIKYNSANKQETIGFVVTVEDANLNTSSFIPVLMAEIKDESGEIRQVDCTELGTIKTVTVGKSCTYTISNISQDGIYQFTCLASDMSGNTTESMIIEDSNKQTMTELNYSVNRNGSTYSLGEATRKLVNNFVKAPIDVVVYETNPDEISNIKITLFKNDETLILEDGKDYVVKKVSDKGEWYKYEYTIYDTNFADDGTYRISIYSEDKAGNIAENNLDVKDVEISFGIDKTLPNLIVTNLESKATYPVDKLSVLMRATDNMKLQSITVELDGTVIASWDEEQIQQMSNDLQDFVFEITGDETTAHSVTITLTDIAGNQRIETISDFYVTTNLWIRFINNKVLFYGSIVVCLTMGLVFVLLLMRKRRHQ